MPVEFPKQRVYLALTKVRSHALLDKIPEEYMKNAYELLRQKEADLARVRHEIESLRVVAPLLSEESSSDDPEQVLWDERSRSARTSKGKYK